jgi:hypothetical protein
MRPTNLRRRLAVAGTIGATSLIAAMGIGASVASAAPIDPPGGSVPTAPSFNNGVVNGIRGTGSDTTFFMMQKIGDLYTSAGLYGCTLNGSSSVLYNSTFTSSSGNQQFYCAKNANTTTTDTSDNWNRTEVTEGVDDVGSGAGQNQLCGSTVLDSPLPVDFSRSSKPAGSACGDLKQTGYAKDSVPGVEYHVTPAAFGTSSFYSSVNGGSIGDVTAGWLPGDPTGGPYTGTPLTNISNADNGGGASSTAYRLWCATDATQITDWGQLTNLSASGPGNGGVAKTLGNGAPIGLPIRIMGVNPNSGTESTWASYAESGVSGGGCAANTNTNAATDPNSSTATGDNAGQHILLENNASQIGDYGAADFPGDFASQAVELDTSLYYESNGVYSSVPYSAAAVINGTAFAGTKLTLNGQSNTTPKVLNNLYPTARTLFNIYRTGTVRASTAGFLNWICDSQTGITKQKDNSTGLNFDAELTSTIGSFGFIRLTDNSSVASGGNTPADNVSGGGINTSCASGLNGTSTAGNGAPAVTAVASPQT